MGHRYAYVMVCSLVINDQGGGHLCFVLVPSLWGILCGKRLSTVHSEDKINGHAMFLLGNPLSFTHAKQ